MSQPVMNLQYGMSQVDEQFQQWLDAIPDEHHVLPAVTGTVIFITVGPDIRSHMAASRMLKDIREQIALVFTLAGVLVTTYGSTVAKVLQQGIGAYLPHHVALQIRVIDPECCYEFIETWEPESPPSPPSSPSLSPPSSSSNMSVAALPPAPFRMIEHTSVTVSIDGLNKAILSKILELPQLRELTVRGPLRPTLSAIGDYHRDARHALLWFLGFPQAFQNVQRVVITLDFFDGIHSILQKLHDFRCMTSLELTMFEPIGYEGVLQNHRSLDIALEKGLESLSQLDELILPTQLVTTSKLTLVDLFDRMFASSIHSADGRVVRFYNRRGVLYGTPLLFLPGRNL